METVSTIFSEINNFLIALNVNKWYLLLFISAGYIQKQYLKDITHIKKLQLNDVWRTLILGTIFSLIYAILLRPISTRATWVEFFASYIFSTSLYELLLKYLVNAIVKFVKKNIQQRLGITDEELKPDQS